VGCLGVVGALGFYHFGVYWGRFDISSGIWYDGIKRSALGSLTTKSEVSLAGRRLKAGITPQDVDESLLSHV